MNRNKNKPILEFGIEFLAGLVVSLIPYGADQMNLPHNYWLGLGCWIVAAAIGVRMMWIFPLWGNLLSTLEKGLILFILLAIFCIAFYHPIFAAFHNRHTPASTQQTTLPYPTPSAPPNVAQQASRATVETATTVPPASRRKLTKAEVSAFTKRLDNIKMNYLAQHPNAPPDQVVRDVNKILKYRQIPATIYVETSTAPCATKHGIVINGDQNEISGVHSSVCFTDDVLNITGQGNKAKDITMTPSPTGTPSER